MLKDKLFSVVAYAPIILAILVVSYMDYQDELIEQRNYCQAVELKIIPDYRHIYESECLPLFNPEKK